MPREKGQKMNGARRSFKRNGAPRPHELTNDEMERMRKFVGFIRAVYRSIANEGLKDVIRSELKLEKHDCTPAGCD